MKLKEIKDLIYGSYRVETIDGFQVMRDQLWQLSQAAEVVEISTAAETHTSALNDLNINIKIIIKINLSAADISELLNK